MANDVIGFKIFLDLQKSLNDLGSLRERFIAAKDASNQLGDRLLKLKQEQADYNIKIQETKDRLEQVRQTQGAASSEYKKTSDDLKKLNRDSALHNKTVKETDGYYKKATAQLNSMRSAMDRTGKSVNHLGGRFNFLREQVRQSFSMLTRFVGVFAAFSAIKSVVSTIVEFERAMKQVQAISRATADEMERLSEVARTVGKIYSPKEVAELELILSKLGFTATEIEKATGAIVNLSIATGEDLATSAELAASIIRGFNMDASETAKVTETLAYGLNTSALSLSNMREAIKYVAPVAAKLGWTFEETTAALGKLSNAQIAGSLAGTSLRNIMSELAERGSKLNQVLGNPKSFEEFITALDEIKKSGVSLGDIFQLVEKRATTSLAILIQSSDDLIRYKNDIDGASGAIQSMVDIQMQSASNMLKQLKTDWEAFVTSVDEGDGVISRVFKSFIKLLDATILSLEAMNIVGIMGVFDQGTMLRRIADYSAGLAQLKIATQKLADEEERRIKLLKEDLELRSKSLNKSILDLINEEVVAITLQIEKHKALNNQLATMLGFHVAGNDEYAQRQKLINDLIQKTKDLNKIASSISEQGEGLGLGDGESATKRIALIRKLMQAELSAIKARIDAVKEEKEDTAEGQKELHELRLKMYDVEYKYSKQIAELEIHDAGVKKDILLAIEEEYLQNRKKSFNEWFNWHDERWEKSAEAMRKLFELEDEQYVDDIPFDTAEVVKSLEKDENKIAKAILDISDLVFSNLENIADAQVQAIDRVVDRYDTMVSEIQSALEIEMRLMEQGYANNVTAKRKELEEIKALRDKALIDQQKYVRQQQLLEGIVQGVNLASAISSIVKSAFSTAGIGGTLIAPAIIAAMFSIWRQAKVNAINATYPEFGEGGWVGGKLHKHGGTNITAEKDEFVVSREPAQKYAKFLEAINSGRSIPVHWMFDNNILKDIDRRQTNIDLLKAQLSLDDSSTYHELVKLNRHFQQKQKPVEVTNYNGFRIERKGNKTRKIYG